MWALACEEGETEHVHPFRNWQVQHEVAPFLGARCQPDTLSGSLALAWPPLASSGLKCTRVCPGLFLELCHTSAQSQPCLCTHSRPLGPR